MTMRRWIRLVGKELLSPSPVPRTRVWEPPQCGEWGVKSFEGDSPQRTVLPFSQIRTTQLRTLSAPKHWSPQSDTTIAEKLASDGPCHYSGYLTARRLPRVLPKPLPGRPRRERPWWGVSPELFGFGKTSGKFRRSTAFFSTLSILRTMGSSLCVAKVKASPVRSARPVRPIRWV